MWAGDRDGVGVVSKGFGQVQGAAAPASAGVHVRGGLSVLGGFVLPCVLRRGWGVEVGEGELSVVLE